jgi:hypothetical protein
MRLRGISAGVALQPSGSLRRSVPLAAASVWTVMRTGSGLPSSGRMRASGSRRRPIGGVMTSGSKMPPDRRPGAAWSGRLRRADGDALVVELSPGGERVGSERTAAPGGRNVVIRLLDGGAGEVGLGGGGVFGDGGFDDGVGIGGGRLGWPSSRQPGLEPDAGQLGLTRCVAGVDVDLNGRAGRDRARGLVRAAAEGTVVCRFAGDREGLQIEAEGLGERGLELLQLQVQFKEKIGLVVLAGSWLVRICASSAWVAR